MQITNVRRQNPNGGDSRTQYDDRNICKMGNGQMPEGRIQMAAANGQMSEAKVERRQIGTKMAY